MLKSKEYRKKLLQIENLIASSIYLAVNGLLDILRYSLTNFNNSGYRGNILLFRTGSIGDMVCTVPVFNAVKKNLLGAHLILLTKREPAFNSLTPLTSLIGNNIFDEIIYYNSDELKSLGKIFSLIIRIRKQKIDKVIYLGQYDVSAFIILRDLLFFYFGGCRQFYGFRLNKHRIFRIAQRYCRVFDNETERLLKNLRPLGVSQKDCGFSLNITEKDKQFIDALWSVSTNLKDRQKVAINTGAKISINHWPQESFLQLAKSLTDKYNAFIILIGGPDARDSARFIEANLGNNCLNLCDKTNFMQTAQVLSRCSLLVSCDSGPVHLAAAVNTPVVGIYTARDYPNCWFPSGNNHIILRHDIGCQICLKMTCSTMSCIKSISVEDVVAACSQKLLRG